MNLEELKADIEDRERILSELDRMHPLYPIMNHTLLERREKYEIMKKAQERKGYDSRNER